MNLIFFHVFSMLNPNPFQILLDQSTWPSHSQHLILILLLQMQMQMLPHPVSLQLSHLFFPLNL